MSVKQKYNDIASSLASNVTLVAISKTHPLKAIMEVYDAGERHFGENRHKELIEKAASAPDDIKWHFIGNMQSNKAKYIVPIAYLIHSVDSLSLVEAIDKQASKIGKCQDILLEIHVSKDMTKSGFPVDDFKTFITCDAWREFNNIRIRGVMTMGTFDASQEQLHSEFLKVKELFEYAHQYINEDYFDTISMGMSDDYKIAVECGSTMVRIGSRIFGYRDYTK